METWREHNSLLPLRIYYDGDWGKGMPKMGIQTDSMRVNLEDIGEYAGFRHRWSDNEESNGGLWGDYRWAGTRFSPKVFAYTDPVRSPTDWWVWIDADTVFQKPMDEAFFRRALPDTAIMTWLERPGWGYCEAGWLAFRHQHPTMQFLLKGMRRLYTEDLLWAYPQWHDAFLLQWFIDQNMPNWNHMIQTLSDTTMKQLNPWPETILQDYITHNKGNAKNARTTEGP